MSGYDVVIETGGSEGALQRAVEAFRLAQEKSTACSAS
jgi:hypothetical protein